MEQQNEWAMFLAVKHLVLSGTTLLMDIAEELGLYGSDGYADRVYVQPRVNLARLPGFVQAEYYKLCCEGADATPVRWRDTSRLYYLYSREYAEYPDGNGPEFQEAWDRVMHPIVHYTQ